MSPELMCGVVLGAVVGAVVAAVLVILVTADWEYRRACRAVRRNRARWPARR